MPPCHPGLPAGRLLPEAPHLGAKMGACSCWAMYRRKGRRWDMLPAVARAGCDHWRPRMPAGMGASTVVCILLSRRWRMPGGMGAGTLVCIPL